MSSMHDWQQPPSVSIDATDGPKPALAPRRRGLYVSVVLLALGLAGAFGYYLSSRSVDSLLEAGHTALLKTHDYEQAVRSFSTVLERADRTSANGQLQALMAYRGRGYCSMEMHDYAAAAADFEQALQCADRIQEAGPTPFDFSDLRKDHDLALQGLAALAERASQASGPAPTTAGPPPLRWDPFRGLEIPENVRALMSRALEELLNNQFVAARATLDTAIAATADHPGPLLGNLHALRGTAHLKEGHKEAALADYEVAVRQGCLMASAFHNRACLLAEQKDYAAAIAEFNRAIELDSAFASSYHYRGLVYRKLGMSEAAQRDLSKAKDLDPEIEQTATLRFD